TGQMDAAMEGVKKDFGEPLLEAMIPALEGVVQQMQYGRGELRLVAKTLGKDVGVWVHDAAQMVEQGFKYLRDHQQEIRKAMQEGVADVRALVTWILAHKVELMAVWGAGKVVPMIGKAGGAVGALTRAAATGVPALGAAGGGVAAGGGMIATGATVA